jgi:hypothetical protein
VPKYRVYFNKHKYQDMSDPARSSSVVVKSDSAEDAGHLVAAKRNATDVNGIRTPSGTRYYIGIIHWNATKKVGR